MKVLILDDDHINLKLFSHMLKGVGGVTTVALEDPLKALDWCRNTRPDLVLLDYMMPVMNGLEFLTRLRAMFVEEPVATIMMTADTDRAVRHRALQLGANDFLTKPMDHIELQARVRNLLVRRQADVALMARAEALTDAVTEAACAVVAGESDAVHRLARLAEFRDADTGSHLVRMAQYARILAAGLGLDAQQQELICAAAPMHDIGKIGIPDQILLKPGRLDSAELACMRTHARIGADILSGSNSSVLQAAAEIALSHHEKYDGSGYPCGLKGNDIPLYGRIVAVADVFDALTSARPYKPAWDVARAFAMIESGAGSHFDPACVRAFVAQRAAVLAVYTQYCDDATP
ncbi:HD-GYP domain-containing protein [Massilia sp. S19_KUP03_FR1]|uniref:HD-GYP domain-containing protein n=1 Tax=Massilia sp. S19_KUP03_FR1 TaxID=3025503 RepID=UPI002FCD84D8